MNDYDGKQLKEKHDALVAAKLRLEEVRKRKAEVAHNKVLVEKEATDKAIAYAEALVSGDSGEIPPAPNDSELDAHDHAVRTLDELCLQAQDEVVKAAGEYRGAVVHHIKRRRYKSAAALDKAMREFVDRWIDFTAADRLVMSMCGADSTETVKFGRWELRALFKKQYEDAIKYTNGLFESSARLDEPGPNQGPSPIEKATYELKAEIASELPGEFPL